MGLGCLRPPRGCAESVLRAPETAVAVPRRGFRGPRRPPGTPYGRAEPSTGHADGVGAASGSSRSLARRTRL